MQMSDAARSRGTIGRDGDWWPVVIVLVTGAAAFVVSGASVSLFRDTFHYNCSWGIGGEWGADGWMCGDAIGYLMPAVRLGGMAALLLLVGVFVAMARTSIRRTVAFVVMAAVSLGWVAWWTYMGAVRDAGARPTGETGAGVWTDAVLPAVIVAIVGLMLGGIGCMTSYQWSPVVVWGGVGLTLVATAMQPGIGVGTVVSAGMLAAAGVARATGAAHPTISAERPAPGRSWPDEARPA